MKNFFDIIRYCRYLRRPLYMRPSTLPSLMHLWKSVVTSSTSSIIHYVNSQQITLSPLSQFCPSCDLRRYYRRPTRAHTPYGTIEPHMQLCTFVSCPVFAISRFFFFHFINSINIRYKRNFTAPLTAPLQSDLSSGKIL